MAKATTTGDSSSIFVCISSFLYAGADGNPVTVREGIRLRGDHPSVRHLPSHFLADGVDDETIHERKQQLRLGTAGDK